MAGACQFFLTGLGLGFVGLPPIICVQYYFNKRRPFALGFSMVGHGLGTLFGMPLLQYSINTLGWRGTVILHAVQTRTRKNIMPRPTLET